MKLLLCMLTMLVAAGCTAAAAPRADGALPAPLRDAILLDAAQRSGVAQPRLQVRVAQAVVWPDGALGCAQPGVRYTQALVPGWRIEVAVPDAPPLAYHAARRGHWVWCAWDRSRLPPGTPPTM